MIRFADATVPVDALSRSRDKSGTHDRRDRSPRDGRH